MEDACALCYNLVLHGAPHTALKKISALEGSELYKCCCCYAYLHKNHQEWEIISAGECMGTPQKTPLHYDGNQCKDPSANPLVKSS